MSPTPGWFSWFIEPFIAGLNCDTTEFKAYLNKDKKSIPTKINYNLLFRPQNFDQYIGQTRAKTILQAYITAIKQRNIILPHILIHGKPGCGKTTLAKIIANEIKLTFKEIITSNISDTGNLFGNILGCDGGVLFLDEIHSIERPVAESIYSIMEDFKYEDLQIKPFTLIGATTEIGEIIRNRKPFIDRFKIIIELEDYTIEDLIKLIKQYKNIMFPNDAVKDDNFCIIAENCRLTPRTAIRLLEALVYLNDNIEVVLKNFNIIKNGYTENDLKILKYIAMNEKGIGLQGLVSYLETSDDNYLKFIEPYLLKNELILRTARGRKITEKGKQMIISLTI